MPEARREETTLAIEFAEGPLSTESSQSHGTSRYRGAREWEPASVSGDTRLAQID